MEHTPCTYRISVKAIIRDDANRILLVREKDGVWELPGGGLEHGEDPREALMREIREEINYTVEWMSEEPEAFWTINKEVKRADLKWFAFVVYKVKASGTFDPTLHRNDEAEEVAYFSEAEARTINLHDNTKPYFHRLAG